jgi:hypothetical protein
MRALKAVVLALGTLCLGAFGVLVYLVVAGMGNPAGRPAAVPVAGPPAPAAADSILLDLPPGTQVVSIAAAGELLAIHVRVPGEPDRVVVVDPRTGAVRLNVSPRTP